MSIHERSCDLSLDNLLALEGSAIDFFMDLDELEQSDFRSACGFLVSGFVKAAIGKQLGQTMMLEDLSLVHLFSDHDRWPVDVNVGRYNMKIARGIGQQPFVCFEASRVVPA